MGVEDFWRFKSPYKYKAIIIDLISLYLEKYNSLVVKQESAIPRVQRLRTKFTITQLVQN